LGRKYQMIRVAKGDYLLPSNDGSQFFRITSYEADGSTSWVDQDGEEHVDRGTFWDGFVYNRGSAHDAQRHAQHEENLLDWIRWDCTVQMQRTRKDVVDHLLRDPSEGPQALKDMLRLDQ
jgi:hypothetical protein